MMPESKLDFMTDLKEQVPYVPEPAPKTIGVGLGIAGVYAPIALFIIWIMSVFAFIPIILLTIAIWWGTGFLVSKVYNWILQQNATSERRQYFIEKTIKRATIIIPLIGIVPYSMLLAFNIGYTGSIEWNMIWFSLIMSVISGVILFIITRNAGDDYLVALDTYRETHPHRQKAKRNE